mmetsp:Transcript_51589/g.120776  ORF Transcript_51589/g.120776 Transcript_51589/m.120776 type:complete len:269 (-) Transcript_51589:940-1746(-)
MVMIIIHCLMVMIMMPVLAVVVPISVMVEVVMHVLLFHVMMVSHLVHLFEPAMVTHLVRVVVLQLQHGGIHFHRQVGNLIAQGVNAFRKCIELQAQDKAVRVEWAIRTATSPLILVCASVAPSTGSVIKVRYAMPTFVASIQSKDARSAGGRCGDADRADSWIISSHASRRIVCLIYWRSNWCSRHACCDWCWCRCHHAPFAFALSFWYCCGHCVQCRAFFNGILRRNGTGIAIFFQIHIKIFVIFVLLFIFYNFDFLVGLLLLHLLF